MRVLFITPHVPSLRNGGGIFTYCNLRALLEYPGIQVDYFGPPWIEKLEGLESDKMGLRVFVTYTHMSRLDALLHMASSSLISGRGQFKKMFQAHTYDMAIVDTSKVGFVFRYLKCSSLHTVSIFHNVELDYSKQNRPIWKTGFVRKSELQTLNSSTHHLVLHREDAERLAKVYAREVVRPIMPEIYPLCGAPVKNQELLRPYGERTIQGLFLGSLDLKYNQEGLISFIAAVTAQYPKVPFSMLVAGRNPPAHLLRYLRGYPWIQVTSNPPETRTVMGNARCLILPDLFGAGMKVRVAEALSCGLPVVGTEAGLTGYGEISRFGVSVSAVQDLPNALMSVLQDEGKWTRLSKQGLAAWKEEYSYEALRCRLHRLLDGWLEYGSG